VSGAISVFSRIGCVGTWPAMTLSLKRRRPTSLACILSRRSRLQCSVSTLKSAIQALDRLDPVLPLSPGRAERHGFEYFRHGTLQLALNFGKPDLHLIKPTGIGRRVVDSYGWISLEELENILGSMCAQVVDHDVNLLAPQAGWRQSGRETRQTRCWYAEGWSLR